MPYKKSNCWNSDLWSIQCFYFLFIFYTRIRIQWKLSSVSWILNISHYSGTMMQSLRSPLMMSRKDYRLSIMAEQMEMSWFTVLRWDACILWDYDYESKLLQDIVLSFLFDIIIYFINYSLNMSKTYSIYMWKESFHACTLTSR